MYQQPTTPLSIGGVLDDAIKLYRASLRSCWVASLVGALASLATSILMISAATGLTQDLKPGTDPRLAVPKLMALFPSVGKFYLLLGLISLVMLGVLFAQISSVHRGRGPQPLGEAFALTVRRLPGMVLASIVFAVAAWIGMILLVVPGIYLWGKLEFWIAAVFADDVGGIEGLGRSWNLTTGNWWRSVTILSIALIMIFVLQVLVYVISASMGTIPSLITPDVKTLAFVVPQLLRAAVLVFVFPIYPAVWLAIYHDMKLRREGGDLAARVNALQSA